MTAGDRKVGVALGGGGVRGLGHVPALEAMDAFGIVPSALAGTSMGAIIAALYASGRTGAAIRDLVGQHIVTRDDSVMDVYAKRDFLLKWLDGIRFAWKGSGLFTADGFLRYLLEQMDVEDFDDLKIPLKVVATDFYTGEPVVIESGPLLPALKASMSIPGVFVPVEYLGRVLVDGGMSNNLPYDMLAEDCDLTIAVDVAPTRTKQKAELPGMIDATLGMFDMLVERITKSMLQARPPGIYFHPRLVGIRVLEFDKAEDVFLQVEESMDEFRERLSTI